ncbi:hypothetical protein ACIQUL_34370 [Streptomyces sp. NPDC090303]|uniref:hypothetical protein n=1 Tax=Streptomyces sp. NPDC090303 TaxID=3365960 RepID=UPI0038295FD4
MRTGPDSAIWHVRCRPDTTADGHRRVLDLLGDYTPVVQPLPPGAALAQPRGAAACSARPPNASRPDSDPGRPTAAER